jgi:hypothetical protein
MYMWPAASSATSLGPQKPADVAGPPSPNSVPPPATLVISPSATSRRLACLAASDAEATGLAVFEGSDRSAGFRLSPQATRAADIATSNS